MLNMATDELEFTRRVRAISVVSTLVAMVAFIVLDGRLAPLSFTARRAVAFTALALTAGFGTGRKGRRHVVRWAPLVAALAMVARAPSVPVGLVAFYFPRPDRWLELLPQSARTGIAVGQAFQPDIPKSQAGKPDLQKTRLSSRVSRPCLDSLGLRSAHAVAAHERRISRCLALANYVGSNNAKKHLELLLEFT